MKTRTDIKKGMKIGKNEKQNEKNENISWKTAISASCSPVSLIHFPVKNSSLYCSRYLVITKKVSVKIEFYFFVMRIVLAEKKD